MRFLSGAAFAACLALVSITTSTGAQGVTAQDEPKAWATKALSSILSWSPGADGMPAADAKSMMTLAGVVSLEDALDASGNAAAMRRKGYSWSTEILELHRLSPGRLVDGVLVKDAMRAKLRTTYATAGTEIVQDGYVDFDLQEMTNVLGPDRFSVGRIVFVGIH